MPGRCDRPRTAPPVLTRAELEVFVALDDLIDELGYAPTQRQILARLGWSSPSAVHEYLERLRVKGVVDGSGRSLVITGRPRPPS